MPRRDFLVPAIADAAALVEGTLVSPLPPDPGGDG